MISSGLAQVNVRWVMGFLPGVSKISEILDKNQHTERKCLYFLNRNNGKSAKIGHILY